MSVLPAIVLALLATGPDGGTDDGGLRILGSAFSGGTIGTGKSHPFPPWPTPPGLTKGGPYFTVRVGKPAVSGPIDVAQLERQLKINRNQALYCFERQLSTKPSLRGTVALKWVVGPDGKVASAESTGGTMNSPEVAACLVGRVKIWLFPKPRGGNPVTVSCTYDFIEESQ